MNEKKEDKEEMMRSFSVPTQSWSERAEIKEGKTDADDMWSGLIAGVMGRVHDPYKEEKLDDEPTDSGESPRRYGNPFSPSESSINER